MAEKLKTILSIDGGGIRGIIPALVLAAIEERAAEIENNGRETIPTAELFDLIAGTSTGGILALGLSKNGGGGSQEQYSAQELAGIYDDRGNEIFNRSFWKGVSSIGGLADETYSSEGLENVLNEYFGETPLHRTHPATRTLIACYDLGAREPLFFKSWNNEHRAVRMRDVARATSAAPTYFEPIQICVGSQLRTLIDGGIFINTPVVSAYAEMIRMIAEEGTVKHSESSNIFVVSLGTGKFTREIQYEEARGWGKAEWLLPALSCIFDGVSDAADYQMTRFVGEENYVRLQAPLIDADDDMDNASSGNIKNLRDVANRLIENEKFERICNRLIQSGPVDENST